ncbi:hypothetical protein [Jeotgalibaca dankookensis]|uniref:hypothetical protein n=1 Tax=Jeotgalibaca dankookensis TaxID=708126 RepID=UPI00078246FC|nr:hypothetical protein [Jeotgalibaca dankookensis]
MYNKWLLFIKEKPVLSTITIALIASIVGITIQFLIDGSFVKVGLFVTVALVIVQIWYTKKDKNNKNSHD